jgi:lysophospholipase L1-like esterase
MGGGTWAQNLPRWLRGNVVVANHAESGQTIKGFRFQRRWDKVMESVKPGDYLFIQLGTNDQKSRGHDPMWPADDKAGDWIRTHSDAETDYIWELAIMVVEARRHGVIPVIVSPLSKFDRKTLKPTSVMDAYGKNAGKAAELTKCAFIDLWSMSKDIINAVGEDGLKVYSDGTHTADYGGYLFSLCIAKGIKENKLELAKFLSGDLIDIDTKNPTPRLSDFNVPIEKRR